jgi:hypothetical protein
LPPISWSTSWSSCFHVPIFIFLFQIHSSSVIPSFRGSLEKFVTV